LVISAISVSTAPGPWCVETEYLHQAVRIGSMCLVGVVESETPIGIFFVLLEK
jgi:hypothetical protein